MGENIMKYYIWKNKLHLKSAQVWFANIDEYKTIKASVIHLSGYPEIIKGSICHKQNSLILNLNQSEEDLFGKINKTVRYEINRSIKENLQVKILKSNEITDDIIDSFKTCYNKMYEEKGINCHLPVDEFKRYISNNMLTLTYVSDEEEILAYHVYVGDEKTTRLLYSCSTFREDDAKKALIGRANKFLHWEDIRYFKSNNYEKYDLGGISSFDNPNGIDKFKMNFNGEKITYYNIITGNDLLGKILCFLIKFKR